MKEREGRHGTYGGVEPYFTRLAREDPEKLAEIGRKAATSAARKAKGHGLLGAPAAMTKHEYAIHLDASRKLARKIMKMLDKEGSLPTNAIARDAMQKAIELLAADTSVKDKITVIRTLLEYNMSKPAAITNLNVKTAEDFLDELAADE